VAQTQEGYTKLGRELYALNADAVAQRYEEPMDLELAQSYEFAKNWSGPWLMVPGTPPAATDVEQYKALCCLIYQCSEGDVPETKLYKLLVKHRQDLAERIVHDLPAYDLAPWD
jgi:hypothetical protein